MPLSNEQVDHLLRLIGQTAEVEIHCEQCLAVIAEFAERQLSGESIREDLKVVERHLSICDECRQEYQALLRTLDALDEPDRPKEP